MSAKRSLLLALVVVLVVIWVAVAYKYVYKYVTTRTTDGQLAESLVAHGWTLYTKPGCSWCVKQAETLGKVPYPKLVVCDGKTDLCEGVSSYPTWIRVDGTTVQTVEGAQSRAKLEEMAGYGGKETLRSRGNIRAVAKADQCTSGIGCGLGSTWIDPRFEPGPREMYPGGDAAFAHGGHSGGPTFGAYIPAIFQTSGNWNLYQRGLGDGELIAPTAGSAIPQM